MPEFFSFSIALEYIKGGKSIARKGWNGKGMYIYLDNNVTSDTKQEDDVPESIYEPCVVMFTADRRFQPGWLCSQADMLAEDWCIVEHL